MNSSIVNSLDAVLSRINDAALAAHRNPSDITLVAVSKTKSVEVMNEFASCARDRGLPVVFGENYLQEMKSKVALIATPYELHMIGPLQSNKVKDAVRIADVIESVHSMKVLEMIQSEAAKGGKTQRIFLQANISGDPSKNGFGPRELEVATARALELSHSIELEGFMTITAFYEDPGQARPDFRAMHELREDLRKRFARRFLVSMGMSADFDIAISEGADVVRVGSALFGERG